MGEKMRVLHIIGKLGSGGIENFVINIYRHIDRTQIQFDFIVFRDKKEFYEEEVKRLGGKKIVLDKELSANLFVRLKRIFRFYLFLKQHSEYQLVHIHMSTPSSSIEYALIAKLLKRKILTHAHASGDYRDGRIRRFMYAICRKLLWKLSDVALACSEAAAIWLFSEKHNKEVKVIYNGIDFSQFVYNKLIRYDIRSKYHLKNYYVIGHIGRFAPEKNQKFLIEMIQEVKKLIPIKLILIGDGNGREYIEKLVCHNKLDQDVIFIGESHEVSDLLQAMDIFLLPSLYEGLGIAALEAQASGLPCVLSKGVPEEVKCTQECVFLSLDDGVKKWADKVIELCANKKRQSITMENKNIMKFDICNNTKIITEIYSGGGYK